MLIYPAKCDRTFEGAPSLMGEEVEVTTKKMTCAIVECILSLFCTIIKICHFFQSSLKIRARVARETLFGRFLEGS